MFCGVGILSRWGAAGPYKNVGGCDTVVQFAEFAVEEGRTELSLLVAMQGGGVRNSGMADVLVLFEVLFLSTAGKEMWLTGLWFRCMRGGSV